MYRGGTRIQYVKATTTTTTTILISQPPIFVYHYQELLYEALLLPDFCNPLNHNFKDKHLWIKKATGLQITEFFLRFMPWLCLRNNDYRNSQMYIVTGPNIDIAIKLIKRMKSLFERKFGLTVIKISYLS
jgi:hypothetical protein